MKRVVFCTYPSLYSSLVLSKLLREPSIEIVGVISSTRNLRVKENKLASDIERISISGIRYAFYLLVITKLYRIFPRYRKQLSVEKICQRLKIPMISTPNINTNEKFIENLDPDILFCAHFNQLVHPDIYRIAKEAAVNLHPSLLPNLKGVDPAFYALADSYDETGVTIHHLGEDFDTGNIIDQTKQKITTKDTLLSLNTKLFTLGTALFTNFILNQTSENKELTVKNKSSDRYDSWPSKSQVKEFKKSRNLIFNKFFFR